LAFLSKIPTKGSRASTRVSGVSEFWEYQSILITENIFRIYPWQWFMKLSKTLKVGNDIIVFFGLVYPSPKPPD